MKDVIDFCFYLEISPIHYGIVIQYLTDYFLSLIVLRQTTHQQTKKQ